MRYASTRLNAVCSPIPSAIGVPKRATSSASEPSTRRCPARSLGVLGSGIRAGSGDAGLESPALLDGIARALEAVVGDLAALAHQSRAIDEPRRDRIVIAARPRGVVGVRVVLRDARHEELAHVLAH